MFNSESSEQILKDMIFCSITGMIFLDPVVVDSGQIYERDAIQKHFLICYQQNKPWTCPKTNMIISERLIPSIMCRQMVDNYLKKFPEQRNQQYTLLDEKLSLTSTRLNFFKKYAYQEVFQLPTYVAIFPNAAVNEDLIDIALYSEAIQYDAKKSFLSALTRHSQPTLNGEIKYDNQSFVIRDILEMEPVINLAVKKYANTNAVFLFLSSQERLHDIVLRVYPNQPVEFCKIEVHPEMQKIILTSTHQNMELEAIELKLNEPVSMLSSMLMCIKGYILNLNTNEQTSRVGCIAS